MHDHEGAADTRNVYRLNKVGCSDLKPKNAFFKKSSTKTLFLCWMSVAVLLLTGAFLTLCILYARLPMPVNLCDSEECMRIAASLKETMDTSVDPCDDFYKFTCGRWSESYPSPDANVMNSWMREKTRKSFLNMKDMLEKNCTENEPESVRKVKTFYASCMNEEARNKLGLDTLYGMMEEMGLPLIPGTLDRNSTTRERCLVDQLARVKRNLWVDVFFGMQVTEDPNNPRRELVYFSHHIMNFFSPILNSRKIKQYFAEDETPDAIEELCEDPKAQEETQQKKIMFRVLKYVIVNATVLKYNITYNSSQCESSEALLNSTLLPSDDQVRSTVDRLWNLQFQIQNLTEKYDNASRQRKPDDYKSTKHYVYLDDLQEATDAYVRAANDSLKSRFVWKPFIRKLVEGVVEYNFERRIYIDNVDFFKELALILAKTDDELLETAIWWTVVMNFIPQSLELKEIWFEHGAPTVQSMSLRCAAITYELMGTAVARMVANSSLVDKKAGEKVHKMFELVKLSFTRYLKKADWIDPKSRREFMDKGEKMRSLIGFPNLVTDENSLLDVFFKQIDMANDTYYANKRTIIGLAIAGILLSLQRNEVNYEEFWLQTLLMINAFYEPDKNQIVIPAGILQFPFYSLGLEAMNFGAIGAILGHELTHGYDNHSKTYDKDGIERNFLTDKTLGKYKDLSQCFVDQYGNFTFPETGERVNGSRTLNENIADNGGLRQVFEAYQMWKSMNKREPRLPGFAHLSHEQLLFLAYANTWCWTYYPSNLKSVLRDGHSPPVARVTIGLQNSRDFAKAWNCPVGSRMNPAKKCHLW